VLLARLNREVGVVMASPDIRETLIKQGLSPVMSTPEELAAVIRADLQRWAKVIAAAKITPD
jgi:tripartite-type tricarboxylate transporter receptor subunit TctC